MESSTNPAFEFRSKEMELEKFNETIEPLKFGLFFIFAKKTLIFFGTGKKEMNLTHFF